MNDHLKIKSKQYKSTIYRKIQGQKTFCKCSLENFRENFKFNQTDPAVTPGRHDWNVFVVRKLKLNFVASEERCVFLGEGSDDVCGNWGG